MLALCALAEENAFKKRGSAFFRVWGDGVLQIIKFEYQNCFSHHSLNIGIQSMYGELLPQWFTSSGCIPRYCVLNLIGKKTAVEIVNNTLVFTTPEQQIEVLRKKGIPWLNSITTQARLSEGIRHLDGDRMWWNDSQKIAPYLASGNTNMAEQVIKSIIQQNESALFSKKFKLSEDKFTEAVNRSEYYLLPLRKLLTMIQHQKREEIKQYLENNYSQNCQYARFCMPKG